MSTQAITQEAQKMALHLEARNVFVSYDRFQAVKGVSLAFPPHAVTALIGPSGCGKSSLLRCFNRMNDFIDNFHLVGEIFYDGMNLYSPHIDPAIVRKQIGMVFQKPNPFPGSIYKNIAWAPKLHGLGKDRSPSRAYLDELVETSLRKVALWDEVKDRLDAPAFSLSGGGQQRLCIARAIAMNPKVLLMDEPCASLDPISTGKIEELLKELRSSYTIVIVTHNMQQATRVSQFTAFMYQGELVEFDATDKIFNTPKEELTRGYVQGQFG